MSRSQAAFTQVDRQGVPVLVEPVHFIDSKVSHRKCPDIDLVESAPFGTFRFPDLSPRMAFFTASRSAAFFTTALLYGDIRVFQPRPGQGTDNRTPGRNFTYLAAPATDTAEAGSQNIPSLAANSAWTARISASLELVKPAF